MLRWGSVGVLLGAVAESVVLWTRSDVVLGFVVLVAGAVLSGILWWMSRRPRRPPPRQEPVSSGHTSGRILRW